MERVQGTRSKEQGEEELGAEREGVREVGSGLSVGIKKDRHQNFLKTQSQWYLSQNSSQFLELC